MLIETIKKIDVIPDSIDENSYEVLVIEEAIKIIWILCRSNKEVAEQILTNNDFHNIIYSFIPFNFSSLNIPKQKIIGYIQELLYLQILHCIEIPSEVLKLANFQKQNLLEYFFPILSNQDISVQFLKNMNISVQHLIGLISTSFKRSDSELFEFSEFLQLIVDILKCITDKQKKMQFIWSIEYQIHWEAIVGNLFGLILALQKKSIMCNILFDIPLSDLSGIINSLSESILKDTENLDSDGVDISTFYTPKGITELFVCNHENYLLKVVRRHSLINFLLILQVLSSQKDVQRDKISSFLSKSFLNNLDTIISSSISQLSKILIVLKEEQKNLYLFQYRSLCWLIQYCFSVLHTSLRWNLQSAPSLMKLFGYSLDTCKFVCHGCEAFVAQRFKGWLFNKSILEGIISKIPIFQNGLTTKEKGCIDIKDLIDWIHKLFGAYFNTLLPSSLLTLSESIYGEKPVDSYFLLAHKSMLPLKSNWWLLPIKLWYEESKTNQTKKGPVLSFVYSVLVFSTVMVSSSKISSPTSRGELFLELSKFFLLPGQVYLDSLVSQFLINLLKILTNENNIILFEDKSFNFAKDFIEEYSASSCGQPLFTSFLLFFLQTQHPSDFRKLIWDELQPLLSLIHPWNDFKINESCFLYPLESDVQVLQSIIDAINHNSIANNDFLKKVAIHHLCSSFFNDFKENSTIISPWQKKQYWKQLPNVRSYILSLMILF